MGNRAVIQMQGCEAGIYVHWNGGRASVEGFLQAARELTATGDAQYATARLAQIIGNYFGGNLSVGVDTLDNLDCDNYDNGLYIVDPAKLEIIGREFERGLEEINAEKTASIAESCVALARAMDVARDKLKDA